MTTLFADRRLSTPEAVFCRLAGQPHAVFLDSGGGGPWARWSVLAAGPRECVEAPRGEGGVALARVAQRVAALDLPPARERLPFRAGAIGYAGYGLRHAFEALPAHRVADPLPELWFGIYERALLFDHRERRWHAAGDWPAAELADLLGAPEPPAPEEPPPGALQADFTRAAYEAAVERALEHIRAGDCYQVNLTQRFRGRAPLPPPDLYRRLRRENPAPFAAYLDLGGGRAVLSSSPERFLELRGRRVVTRPIKGTRPRGAGAAGDQARAAELLASAKDRAELAMIVDLLRNDLGRVARWGSVRVDQACALESFASVHHLVATVSATLRPGLGWTDLLRATFPGGSITGAPKIRAMQVIAELEPVERGLYTGSIGYVDVAGDADFSIAIRTLLVDGERVWFNAGGGIVADSDPAAEYAECLDKARPLARVLRAEL